jgi:hypothetical protein
MMSDLDLLRSAKVVLDQHGPDALIYCAQQADKMIGIATPTWAGIRRAD